MLLVNGCHIRTRKLPPCIFDPFHLNLLFRIAQIIRQHTQGTVPE